jgi:DNA-binding response OmpR family regulator
MIENKILIVEDEVKVALSLKEGLEEKGFLVDLAYDGYIGQRMAQSQHYDAIVMDVNLPSVNGYMLCEEIRKHDSKIPILMLTAMGTTEDKLEGFNVGADDYLVKPFEFRELIARINALVKRVNKTVNGNTGAVLKIADLELNTDTKLVKRSGKRIQLTSKEYFLLEYLMRNKERVLSRSDIAEKIWDLTFETGTNVIDVYINFLRKKIDKDFTTKLIHTQKGMGYILTEDNF